MKKIDNIEVNLAMGGIDKMIIKWRNHKKKEYSTKKNITLKLTHKFIKSVKLLTHKKIRIDQKENKKEKVENWNWQRNGWNCKMTKNMKNCQ